MRVGVTGATGLVGRALCRRLVEVGAEVVRVVRRDPGPGDCLWSIEEGRMDAAALEGLDGVVHLAGSPVSVRWTAKNKAAIFRSRVEGTELLVRTLLGLRRPPTVLLSGSATGFYGALGDQPVGEDAPAGEGFLAEVTQAWERATEPASRAGLRVVLLRTGVVIAAGGGALAALKPSFSLGLGGPLGSGRQGMSWISLDDEVGAIVHLLAQPVSGPVNLVAPHAVSQRAFARALGRALGRPAVLPTPGWVVGLLLGEMGRDMALEGAFVRPDALLESGYEFAHPSLDEALSAALASR